MRPALENVKLVNYEDGVIVTVVLVEIFTSFSSFVFCFDSRS